MVYNKQNFTDGHVLCAYDLNHMEEGIYEACQDSMGRYELIDTFTATAEIPNFWMKTDPQGGPLRLRAVHITCTDSTGGNLGIAFYSNSRQGENARVFAAVVNLFRNTHTGKYDVFPRCGYWDAVCWNAFNEAAAVEPKGTIAWFSTDDYPTINEVRLWSNAAPGTTVQIYGIRG